MWTALIGFALVFTSQGYEIEYDKTDWEGINSPYCGPNIKLMNVTVNNEINQVCMPNITIVCCSGVVQ